MNENIKDPELEQLFNAFRPTPEDEEDFMARLQKQLDAIELVRQLQAQQRRRTRCMLLAAFIGGLVVGLLLYLFVMPIAPALPSPATGVQFQLLSFIMQNTPLFATMLLCAMVIACAVVIVSMWLDMAERRENRDLTRRLERDFSR